jgi:NAD(P)-dependent dehydrogenase (short-subunit alcohol dehydrogenase family)
MADVSEAVLITGCSTGIGRATAESIADLAAKSDVTGEDSMATQVPTPGKR